MQGNKRTLTILYGSQTGTAEEVAERIGREGKRRHFVCQVCAMDIYDTVGIIIFFFSFIYLSISPKYNSTG